MRAAAGTAWTFDSSRRARRVPRAELAEALFALAALAIAVAPVLTEQSVDGSSAKRSGSAASSSSAATPAAPEWMLAGYGGVPYTYPSDVVVEKPGVHDLTAKDVSWDGEPFTNPIYYGVRIVRYGAGRLGTMLDFTHSKAIARLDEDAAFSGTLDGAPAPERAKLRDIFRKLEASHGHNMLTLNGLLRLPSFLPRIQPYVGLGAGITLPHSEVQLAGNDQRTYEYQLAGAVGQALFGLEFRTARMSYFVEYKFSFAPYTMPLTEREGVLLPVDLWSQFRNWLSGTAPPGGVLTTTFASHQGIFGLGIRSAPIAAP
ncbi:hypothetical protein [Hyphomicrobium sp.]|uniref:hypothetical protein n=1 Tax=Hyphomicrobium sp. TaxID=82 RepID=UPI003D125B6F